MRGRAQGRYTWGPSSPLQASPQFGYYTRNHRLPGPRALLTKETHRRIPGTILTPIHPAPIGRSIQWSAPRYAEGMALALMAGGGQTPIQVVGCTNQGQVCKGLGKVPQVFATQSEFLSIQAKVISVPERLLEKEAGFVQVTGPRQTLHIPKRAHGKRALLAQEPIPEGVTGLVAVDQ